MNNEDAVGYRLDWMLGERIYGCGREDQNMVRKSGPVGKRKAPHTEAIRFHLSFFLIG
jgi:hypothetical protein